MSDEEFCAVICKWTGIDLSTRVVPKTEEEKRNPSTIRDLLLSGKNKENFFTSAKKYDINRLKTWAQHCGFNGDKCDVIALRAIENYSDESGT